MFRAYIYIVFFSFSLLSFSQFNETDILFSVNNEPVLAGEFVRVYNKNIDLVEDESQKDVDNYLQLYINYKLKLSYAYSRELHKNDNYRKELKKYTNQLKSTFLTDKVTEEKLLLEAYERTKYEVNVSHVLIRIEEEDNDTIGVYNNILNLRKLLLKNHIDSLIKNHHNGKDLIIEDLGYFSAFKMIYKFENVAYNTRIGEVSMPFRTQFGYHILKVSDKRNSLGEINIAHIMAYKNKPGSKEKIYSLYDSIEKGSNFESLAIKYSEDKKTSFKGGKLNPFTSGQFSSIKFENMAFSLNKPNEVSSPVETKDGWHIIKLYSKNKLKPIGEMKSILLNKIKRSSRSSIISNSFYAMLLDKYNLNYENKNLKYFLSVINNSWKILDTIEEEKNLIKIHNKNYNFSDFATYIEENKRSINLKNKEDVVFKMYKDFINKNLLETYKDNLEDENLEYKYILKEYKEGLLLFDLMQEKIWNVASSDSINIKGFYQSNKSKYSSFDDNMGEIISDYQDFLENNWITELKENNSVIINKKILKRIKKSLKK